MSKEEFLNSGLLEQYILGLTTPEEDRMVEKYVQTFPEAQRELNQLKQAMDSYVSEHLAGRPEEAVNSTGRSAPFALPQQARFSWSIVLALFFAALAFYLFQSKEDKKQNVTQLEAEYASLENYYDHKEDALQLSLLSQVQDPRTVSVVVQAVDTNAPDFVVYHWNSTTDKSWLETSRLPLIPTGEFYHIWGKVSGEYVHLGTIADHAHRLIALPYLADNEEIIIGLAPSDTPVASPDQDRIILRTSI